MALVRKFGEFHGLGAMALVDEVPVPVLGSVLQIPERAKPQAFQLCVFVPQDVRGVFVAQKDVGANQGAYRSVSRVAEQVEGYDAFVLPQPIEVKRAGQAVWTVWHNDHPNRVDVWNIGKRGELKLFQVGVVTHDHGKSFRLIGDFRWEGQLFSRGAELIAFPEPGYQAFTTWAPILDHAGFQNRLNGARLTEWTLGELREPTLDPVPSGSHARVDWYTPFTGQNGQGIAKLEDGSPVWVHGGDVAIEPWEDGVKRLPRNTLLSFVALHRNWGSKEGPPKLEGVRLASE